MRIEQVHLHKVGPFEDARIVFPPGTDPNLADVYLLTGPNGSGKSTVLYAIAEAIHQGHVELGAQMLERRLRDKDALAAIAGDGQRFAVAWREFNGQVSWTCPNPFEEGELRISSPHGSSVGYFDTSRADTDDYADAAAAYKEDSPNRRRFAWAAFAYAGQRSLHDVRLRGLQQPETSPFERSLSFSQSADSALLANWIANQKFMQLKAASAGRHERAAALERSVHDIEDVIGQIIDDETFAFVLSDEDNNVRVRREGQVVDLGLLPDGLKSIVSWVADLLMRLERIPWLDETRPMQRSFLLLLDEIDIHLHPAWQRKVLPIVQRMFPNAQIIASTHSPFVVASAADAHVIALDVKNGVATVQSTVSSQVGHSYSAVLRSIFGISNEFDVGTEDLFEKFHDAKSRLLRGDATARADVERLGDDLAQRSDEVRELIGFEKRQLERQLAQRRAP